MVSKPPNAPKASLVSRRLQSILRRIQDHGIQHERAYARKQISRILHMEERMDGYSKSLLDEIRQKLLNPTYSISTSPCKKEA